MNLSNYSKIYIFCEANGQSGGHELLHQLAYLLIKNKKDVKLIYYPISNSNQIPNKFNNYIKKQDLATQVLDITNNLIIISESLTFLLYKYKNAKFVIWWLSIDNYYFSNGKNDIISLLLKHYNRLKYIFRYKSDKASFKLISKKINLVQSYYAFDHLRNKGISNIRFLSDYINLDFLNDIKLTNTARNNIVLYNPKKGTRVTNQIIKFSKKIKPDIEFIPLINMSKEQIIEIMQKAKVYIDFGNHPGKDRIPREAALNGLIVIVGKRGSAINEFDVPIPSKYKISYDNNLLKSTFNILEESLNNYENLKSEFNQYVLKIKQEQNIFEQEVNEIFNN